MTPLAAFVAALSHEDRHAIIQSFEQFERDGFIDDAPIRIHTRAFTDSLGITGEMHTTMWMEQLAKECFRFYYHVTFG